MTDRLHLGDSVALLADAPEHGLVRGHVGALVSLLAEAEWLVDFQDPDGVSYGCAPFAESDLLKIHLGRPAAP